MQHLLLPSTQMKLESVTNGIMAGSGTTLDPQRNVTRLEFAMFLSRSIRSFDLTESQIFSDVPASAAGDTTDLSELVSFVDTETVFSVQMIISPKIS